MESDDRIFRRTRASEYVTPNTVRRQKTFKDENNFDVVNYILFDDNL